MISCHATRVVTEKNCIRFAASVFNNVVAPRSTKNMGFDYHVNVEVAYVQEVGYMNCYSRLATRCLKLRIDPRTKMPKATKKLPGENLPQEVDDAPFSDLSLIHI